MLKEKAVRNNEEALEGDDFFGLLRELSDRGIGFDGMSSKGKSERDQEKLFIHPNGQTIESGLQKKLRFHKQALINWHERNVSLDYQSVLMQIDQMSERYAQKTALSFYGEALSYQSLKDSSIHYASALQGQGVALGMRVGVCLSRSLELIISMLALLRLGAMFVPLSSLNPTERLRTFCEQARLSYILCDDECEQLVRGVAVKILPLELIQSLAQTRTPFEGRKDYSALPAYMMFTSGSSGKPKGVVVSHQALAHNLSVIVDHVGINQNATVLAHSDIGFDISLLELLGPLIVGGTVVLVGDEDCKKPLRLCAEIHSGSCNVVQATPSLWQLLLIEGGALEKDFTLISGGEVLKKQLAKDLLAHHGPFWNLYGPTEATIWVSAQWIDEEVVSDAGLTLPIGLAMGANKLHLVRKLITDEGEGGGKEAEVVVDLIEETRMHVEAELWISGPSLAAGYFENVDLNRKSFVIENGPSGSEQKPNIGRLTSDRYYRTGDVVSKGLDGNLLFHSRLDKQVKLHGYRIELEEIEKALLQHPSVRQAVVCLHELVDLTDEENNTLTAYVVFVPGSHNKTRDKLNDFLARRLPTYMLPGKYLVLEAIPLTSNSKLDYGALRTMSEANAVFSNTLEGRDNSVVGRVHSMICQLTGRNQAGLHESFFDLGGNSMLAATLLMKVNNTFNIDLPLHSILDQPPTIMSVSHLVRKQLSSA